jgi:hypothetical protein
MNLKITIFALLLMCSTPRFLFAQNRSCSAPEFLENTLKSDPSLQQRIESIERHTQAFVQRTPSVSERTVINIPVVVHVVYNAAVENISDAQIQSQIDVLNKDFRKQNAEATAIPAAFFNIAADVEINFCLATTTPTGVVTNGIDRYQTSKTGWSSNDEMKRPLKDGVASWDATHYLNIWVCNLGSGSLGYSSFPGAPLSTDGVVIDYRYFGTINTRAPFHLGRTTTHEVGHWLNLFHIWGDSRCGDDHVEDTPLHHGANFGCPTYPAYNSTCGDNIIEMPMNYMDYSNDACMSMFSLGQKARMRALFVPGGARYSFVESSLCGAVGTPIVCTVPTNFVLGNVMATEAKISWASYSGAQSFTFEYKPNYTTEWISFNNITTNAITLTNLTPATIYNVRVKTQCANGGESGYSNIINFVTAQKVVLQPTCTDNFEPNNTRSAAMPINTNRVERAFIGSLGDRDWYYFKADAGTHVQIALSNLPADYDIKLYDSKLRLLKSSENMGLTDESINFMASRQDSFLIAIYGYNGAFDADDCYSLVIKTNEPTFSVVQKMVVTMDLQQSVSFNRLGQEDKNTEGELKVFPNPANEAVALQIAPEMESDATILLTNLAGQTLMTETRWVSKSVNTIKLDLSTIPSGLYFVTVRQGAQMWTKKLMKR